MSKFVFMLSDNTVKIKSNFQKFFNNNFHKIKYLLIPINDQSFIMHKPKEYMLYFHHCIVEFQMCILHDDIVSYISNQTSKEINSIIELFQYLHSLNRLIYCNKLEYSNEAQFYERTEFSYFKITIFDKNNDELFNKKMDLKTEKGKFGPLEVLENISKIYNPVTKFSNTYLYIDDEWGFNNYPINDRQLYGVLHPYTKSISFYKTPDLQKLLNSVKTCYFCVSTYNPDIVNDDYCEDKLLSFSDNVVNSHDCNWAIRIFDFWTNDISAYLEFIEYSYYIRDNSKIISELNDFNEIKNQYKSSISYEIELFSIKKNFHILKRYVEDDVNFSLESLLNQI